MARDVGPAPERLGRYQILRRLGAGGMAEVFLARSTGAEGIEKLLVVKRILPAFARSAKFVAMFLEEAKIATRLNHPNIVQVYAFEQWRDEFLLAMEYVDGLDLGRLVAALRRRGRRMPAGVAAFVAMEVAKGLDYAHKRRDERGEPMDIVHRDVSPQNILLSYEGAVKVADFGIARARLVTEETGVIKGKFSYMSPEQARGQRVDARSDVYAVGVVLAELLMGRPMYPGLQGLDVLERVRRGEVTPPRAVDPDVPAELDAIVRRALAYDREERYQTARSLAGELQRWLHGQQDVYGAERLEELIAEVAPRELTSPDARREPLLAEALTVGKGGVVPERERRERRQVVVVTGMVRGESTRAGGSTGAGFEPEPAAPGVGEEVVRILEEIAFKKDAVLRWPDGRGRHRFRFILGLRRASVHDPLEAVRMALDVIEALQGVSADMLVPLSAALGICRGTVLVVPDPRGGMPRYEPVGSVFEVADRLAEAGQAGEVLVSGEVHRLTRRAFAFEPAAVREVEVPATGAGTGSGSTGGRRVGAHRLRGARTREEHAAEAQRVGVGGLVGREEELEAIAEAYQTAVATRRSAYLAIVGELGVGKTALGTAALESLDPPARVLRAHCAFGSSDAPYAMVAELVRDACGIGDEVPPSRARAMLGATVAGLGLPPEQALAVVEALEPLVATGDDGARAERERADRARALVRAVRLLVGALAARGPLVMWIDGLQWADAPSLELLHHVLQRTYDVPLLLLVATRPDDRVERVLSVVPRLELGELGEEARSRLLARRLGVRVGRDVERLVVERAGGNPFFLLELVDALLERGVLAFEGEGEERRVVRRPGVPVQLPTTLEGVVAAKVDELPVVERRLVRWLAVAAMPLRGSELEALSGEGVDAALHRLVERGMVRRGHAGAFEIASAVVRHVAYEALDESEREAMHRRIATLLGRRSDRVPPARLARHLERGRQLAEAAAAYLRAADVARQMRGHRDALRFYGRAIALLPPDSPERFRAHEAREDILRALGWRRERLVELEAMEAIGQRIGTPSLRATVAVRRARYELDGVRTQGVGPLLEAALEAAREAGDEALEVEALRLGVELAREEGDLERALQRCDEALARVARSAEQRLARGKLLLQRGILLRRTGRLAEALEANAQAAVVFHRVGARAQEAQALGALGVALASAGHLEDALVVLRTSLVLDRETGERMRLGRKLSNMGQLYAELGERSRALAMLRRAIEAFEVTDDDGGRVDAHAAVAELLIDQGGELERARAELDEARAIAARTDDVYDTVRERIVRAELEQAAGCFEEAVSAARMAAELARRSGLFGYEMLATAVLADALAQAGRADAALEAARRVQQELAARGTVERQERVGMHLARALRAAGAPHDAAEVAREALRRVEQRMAAIRDPVLRGSLEAAAVVRQLRDLAA
ncbi:MAG: protein kinase [Myxococcota bacterium]|nr:protein kinase [Myxococcota bacterium]MDW8363685.1 protein kinase [Myxococcales bacterium]